MADAITAASFPIPEMRSAVRQNAQRNADLRVGRLLSNASRLV